MVLHPGWTSGALCDPTGFVSRGCLGHPNNGPLGASRIASMAAGARTGRPADARPVPPRPSFGKGQNVHGQDLGVGSGCEPSRSQGWGAGWGAKHVVVASGVAGASAGGYAVHRLRLRL